MNVARRLAVLLLFSILWFTAGKPVIAQSSGDTRYFPETGHNVKGEFLRFYENARDPRLLFGEPITEQFPSKDGKIVQYFQRARFELENQRVQLAPLGQATHRSGNQQLPIENPAACETFSTGFRVCLAFLEFYRANGGAAQFGNPISPFEIEDNLIVQYFERARFEWRADRPEGQRVAISNLGRVYFDQLGEDTAYLRPIHSINATIDNVLSIHARAFVQKAITLSNGQQTVYVVVESQTKQPLANANGKATIHFLDGHTEDYFFTTNAAGLGSILFNFADQKQGELVQIEIIVTYQGLSTMTTTSFRIWY